MRLYSGTSTDFISDSVHNRIADRLAQAHFASFRFKPSPSEVNSWRNSLRAMAQLVDAAKLHDHGILLEYQLPLTSKRLDCMITGRDEMLSDQAVIVELKQWDTCNESDGERVLTFVGGGNREVLHPSIQVGQYARYLRDSHTAFYEGDAPVQLAACAYLHNYPTRSGDPLFASKFSGPLQEFPCFTGDHTEALTALLASKLQRGSGGAVLRRVEQSRYRPSKKLLEHVSDVISGLPEYVLLDEQLVAFDRVLTEAREGFKDRRKSVILIRGGPGTGKSVIALNLLGQLAKQGLNAHYATGSRAFTGTLREIVGNRAAAQMKYFSSYGEAQFNDVDALVCDEAHRIRKTSSNQYTPAAKRTGKPQIEELLHASKVSVFFIDDRQVVRPDEIGSTDYILSTAEKHNCRIFDYRLEAQFRCAGSDGFINWVNNTLEVERTANVLWNLDEEFEFKILDSPSALEATIVDKLQEGHKARLTAGFCWPWSNARADGTLVNDVVVGEFRRPWNAKPEARRLASGIPKATLWAYQAGGENQVGCIYTAQGFEFDYVGVIFGKDLVYRAGKGWMAEAENSYDTKAKSGAKGDPQRFLALVKNTYRVLLTRGMKGCYVYFEDQQTRDFVMSRTERGGLSHEAELA